MQPVQHSIAQTCRISSIWDCIPKTSPKRSRVVNPKDWWKMAPHKSDPEWYLRNITQRHTNFKLNQRRARLHALSSLVCCTTCTSISKYHKHNTHMWRHMNIFVFFVVGWDDANAHYYFGLLFLLFVFLYAFLCVLFLCAWMMMPSVSQNSILLATHMHACSHIMHVHYTYMCVCVLGCRRSREYLWRILAQSHLCKPS